MTLAPLTRRPFWSGVLLLLLLAAACTRCDAQDSIPDLSEASLEQLAKIKVYTASRHLQPTQEAPSSVTVITADDIREHGYRTLGAVLQTVRGFFVTYDRNYTSVGVRGFARPGDYNTKILLLVDGHRLNDNIYDEAMIGTEFPIDLDLISRIEIIRGPVSSLYGSDALYAVINIITKRGEDLEGVELSSSAGSFNTYQGRISYGRKLRELEFLVSGSFYGSRGHNSLYFSEFDTPETNHGIASHADDDQVGSALATVSFRGLTLQSVYGTREKGIPTGAYGTMFNNPGTRTTDSHTYIDLRYQRSFGKSWDLLARTFYDRNTYQGTYIYPSPVRGGEITPEQDFADGKWWGVEFQLSKTILRRHRITGGGEYRDNLCQDQRSYDLNPYALQLDDRRHSFVGGMYVQDEFSLTKTLTLNGGLRYDYYSYLDGSANPRAALIYRPRSSTALKFIYGEAFRVPNLYELYYSVLPNLPNPALRPEKMRSTEFIWEQGIGKRLWLSASVFYNQVDGLISQVPVENDAQIFRNLQDARSAGAELEIRADLPHGGEGTASYSFQQTADKDTSELLSNSPRNLVKLSFSQPVLQKRLFVSLDGQYRSRIQPLVGASVSPFAVVNLTVLSRRFGKHLDVSASVYNLLDKQYPDPPSGENLAQAIPQDRRSFRLKMTWHMGGR